MDDIIRSIAKNSETTEERTRSAVSIMLNFVCCIISNEHADTLTGSLPGIKEIMSLNQGTGSNGLMSTYDELKALGIGLDNIQSIAKELVSNLRNVVNEEIISAIKSAVSSESPFWIRFKIKSVISDW